MWVKLSDLVLLWLNLLFFSVSWRIATKALKHKIP